MDDFRKMTYSSKFIFDVITPYRISYTRYKKKRTISMSGNIYSILPIFSIFVLYIFEYEIFLYFGIFIISIYYLSIYVKYFQGYFCWDNYKVSHKPHVFEILYFRVPNRKTINWDEITEINITKPLQRISIYRGSDQIEYVIEGSFSTETSRRELERALLTFARYARLKLRNKPGVVWST